MENVMEELDNPGEFFFNETTQMLYVVVNGSTIPPTDGVVATAAKVNVTMELTIVTSNYSFH